MSTGAARQAPPPRPCPDARPGASGLQVFRAQRLPAAWRAGCRCRGPPVPDEALGAAVSAAFAELRSSPPGGLRPWREPGSQFRVEGFSSSPSFASHPGGRPAIRRCLKPLFGTVIPSSALTEAVEAAQRLASTQPLRRSVPWRPSKPHQQARMPALPAGAPRGAAKRHPARHQILKRLSVKKRSASRAGRAVLLRLHFNQRRLCTGASARARPLLNMLLMLRPQRASPVGCCPAPVPPPLLAALPFFEVHARLHLQLQLGRAAAGRWAGVCRSGRR
jgi:hypothetical protein